MSDKTSNSTLAASPFDSDPHADIILRSSDRVDFHVHKFLLSKASTFFRDMFTLPLTSTSHLRESSQASLPVMDLAEPSSTLDLLLRILYPGLAPPSMDVDNAQVLFEASQKYAMHGVRERVGQMLSTSRFLDTQPLRVYALACAYGFPHVARAAARSSLRTPIFSRTAYVDEFRCMTGGAYHHLVQYHHRCGEVASALVMASSSTAAIDLAWARTTDIFHPTCCGSVDCLICKLTETCVHYNLNQPGYTGYTSSTRPSVALVAYFNCAGAALKSCPHGPVVSTLSLLEPTLVSAAKCSSFGQIFVVKFLKFVKELENAVEKKVSEVKLAFEE
ncbi:hypothetical protein B0H21DRAFT_545041 [Amylocystis lapponica]|nr:hypothetical protein B0H21DRAFT_545041 [Amylocystis lapponica]